MKIPYEFELMGKTEMKVKPCTCGELPDLESSTYGWEAEERTSYYYKCFYCNTIIGSYGRLL